ncbi:sialidase-3 isoform X2 [Catharus ustulatus]|uniref:sialidase-3 isoform X2 n=1 Tax=Catharus ustulatus TaxID=91951 RepID=UPI00140D7DFC|nr:sialidase-3 isoform X2 [Catharus ustulatus]
MSQGEPQGATMSQATTCLKQRDGGESPPALPPPPGSPHIFPPETLFRQAGGVTYRIPALLYVPPDDSFLAFAEKRSSARDEDAKYLVLRRGRRHGCSVKWGPVEELSALALPRHRTMNPCPLFDARSGTVFLFCICVEQGKTERCQIWRGCSAARLCFASSADGGRGWSALRDVTGEAIGADLARWATFAVGPGHGVQLRSGRLVVPAYAYYVHGALRLPCFTRQHSLVFYSDDGGRRWHKGAPLGGQRTGECQVAEIPGGQRPLLYCSARAPRGCRAVALSADQGLRFQRPAPCPALGEPPRGCQGSVLSFAAAGARTWLLYSHPTDRRGRRDLGLYVNPSPLDGAGWRRPWVLHAGPAGYSDLAACPGLGVFGCLFECGASSACEEIAFCLFTLDLSGDRDLKAD